MVLAGIELDLGHRRLGERAHVGDRDALVAPEAFALAHAKQHRHVDALGARRAHPHDGDGLLGLAQRRGGQVVVDARGLRATGEQPARHGSDSPEQPVPPTRHNATIYAIAEQ